MSYKLPDWFGDKITKRLDLGGYAQSLVGNYVSVWLNTDEAFGQLYHEYTQSLEDADRTRQEYEQAEGAAEDFAARFVAHTERTLELACEMYSRLWSVPVEEVRKMYEAAPGLYRWVAERAWELRAEYHGIRVKKGES